MTCWIVVPIKSPEACKTRLSGTVPDERRRALVAEMLEHVVATASAVVEADQILLLGPDRHGLPDSIPLLADPGRGLNAALTAAVQAAAQAGVDRIIFLPADLPLLTAADVASLCDPQSDAVLLAPDRHGTGTNALSLPVAAARDFAFAYGPGSYARHAAEARRLGRPLIEIDAPTLALDIDLPEDLETLTGEMARIGNPPF